MFVWADVRSCSPPFVWWTACESFSSVFFFFPLILFFCFVLFGRSGFIFDLFFVIPNLWVQHLVVSISNGSQGQLSGPALHKLCQAAFWKLLCFITPAYFWKREVGKENDSQIPSSLCGMIRQPTKTTRSEPLEGKCESSGIFGTRV